jgi:hypothetical protein
MPTLPGCEGPTQTQQKLARSGGGALAEAAATETKARSSVTTTAFILERRSGGGAKYDRFNTIVERTQINSRNGRADVCLLSGRSGWRGVRVEGESSQ